MHFEFGINGIKIVRNSNFNRGFRCEFVTAAGTQCRNYSAKQITIQPQPFSTTIQVLACGIHANCAANIHHS